MKLDSPFSDLMLFKQEYDVERLIIVSVQVHSYKIIETLVWKGPLEVKKSSPILKTEPTSR